MSSTRSCRRFGHDNHVGFRRFTPTTTADVGGRICCSRATAISGCSEMRSCRRVSLKAVCWVIPRCLQVQVQILYATCAGRRRRSEEHTSELQSRENLVCRLLLEKKK